MEVVVERPFGSLIAFAFGYAPNPLQKPETINYPVPMAGDASAFRRAGLHRHYDDVDERSILLSRVIRVSSRNLFARTPVVAIAVA